MSNITKTITISSGSITNLKTKVKEIKIDPKHSWLTCQKWFDKNMKKNFLEGKYGEVVSIKWYDGKTTEYRIKRSSN
jgi:hypothetical protein